jgi:hypothetical protein
MSKKFALIKALQKKSGVRDANKNLGTNIKKAVQGRKKK